MAKITWESQCAEAATRTHLGIDGKEFHINKLTIVTKQELHTSMMPPGLAHTLTLSELRDLLLT